MNEQINLNINKLTNEFDTINNSTVYKTQQNDLIELSENSIFEAYKLSDLYKIQILNDTKIVVPINKYLDIREISSLEEFYNFLEIMQYWGFFELPDFIYIYVLNNQHLINNIQLNLYPKKNIFFDNKLLSFGDILKLILKNDKNDILNLICIIGYLDCLIKLHKNGCKWNVKTCGFAAQFGHLDCLIYAHKNGCKWNGCECAFAAHFGHLDCLIYAHKNGCSWNSDTCKHAVQNGHYDCLKYAHDNGCSWNSDTCSYAVQNGHYGCLEYAHKNGCHWNSKTCEYAYNHGEFYCLKYANENGCEWNYKTCSYTDKMHIYINEKNLRTPEEAFYHYTIYYSRLECLKYAWSLSELNI